MYRTLSLIAVTLAVVPAALPAQGAFGASLAISGREVYVGQPDNVYGPGVVYLFRPDARGAWSGRAAQKLTRSDASNGDGFGAAIAVDGNVLLVGATKVDSEAGVVYVFTRDAARGSSWRERGTLKAPERHPGDAFGAGIVLADGRAYISTGVHAFGSMVFTRRSGSVYVFRTSGGTWAAETTLTPAASDTVGSATFGSAVAASGSRLMIGNSRADSGTGAVYVFNREASGSWQLASRLSPPGPITGKASGFGSAIVLRSDTALIGAANDRGAGAVWVYSRDTASGHWNPVTRALPFDGSFGSRFGSAVAEVGTELWVGAVGANGFAGRVYRITRDTSGFATVAKLGPNNLDAGDGFGGKIAAGGTLAAVAIGNAEYGEGAVALYARAPSGVWRMAARLEGDVTSLTAITGANRECNSGKIAQFDCNQVDLLSFLPVSALGGKRGVQMNDVWGYSDPETGHDYVLAGRFDGTAFVDVTDPTHPVYLGELPKTAGSPGNFWRDIKTYKHYAFIVADGSRAHGMQVFDLNKLRNVRNAPVTFTEDAHYSNIHSAHNIVSDTATGFMYIVGASGGGEMCGGGLHIVDVRDPLHPKFAGCFSDPATGRQGTGYSHDAQCVVYHGPSAKYQGREICFGFNETAIDIADVTDKQHPVAIAHATYPNVAYAHQGWLTEDQRYVYEDDELDELEGFVDGTRTLIWDVSDLDNPVLAGQYISQNRSTDHNLFVTGNTMYQSNYVSGLRVVDISDRTHPKQIGFFDTHPVGPDEPGFAGTWGNYPFFKSGVVAVTSMQEGLFILKKHPTPPVP